MELFGLMPSLGMAGAFDHEGSVLGFAMTEQMQMKCMTR